MSSYLPWKRSWSWLIPLTDDAVAVSVAIALDPSVVAAVSAATAAVIAGVDHAGSLTSICSSIEPPHLEQ